MAGTAGQDTRATCFLQQAPSCVPSFTALTTLWHARFKAEYSIVPVQMYVQECKSSIVGAWRIAVFSQMLYTCKIQSYVCTWVQDVTQMYVQVYVPIMCIEPENWLPNYSLPTLLSIGWPEGILCGWYVGTIHLLVFQVIRPALCVCVWRIAVVPWLLFFSQILYTCKIQSYVCSWVQDVTNPVTTVKSSRGEHWDSFSVCRRRGPVYICTCQLLRLYSFV